MAKNKPSQPQPAEKEKETVVDQSPAVDTSAEETAKDDTAEDKPSQPQPAVQIDVATVTSAVVSSSATPVTEDPSLVKVLIKYPDEYPAKKRFFQDGETRSVSKESAEAFIAAGIATKVE